MAEETESTEDTAPEAAPAPAAAPAAAPSSPPAAAPAAAADPLFSAKDGVVGTGFKAAGIIITTKTALKILPMVSRIGKGLLSRAFIPVTIVAGGVETAVAVHQKDGHKVAKAVGGTVGGLLAGAAVGAAVGSVVPVVGTFIGGAIGAAVGYWGGSKVGDAIAGNWADRKLKGDEDAKATDAEAPAQKPSPAQTPVAAAITAATPAAAIAAKTAPDTPRQADIAALQAEMTKRGLYKGPANGEWSPDTNHAFNDFLQKVQSEGNKDGSYTGDVDRLPGPLTRESLKQKGADPALVAAMERLGKGGVFREVYKREDAAAGQPTPTMPTKYMTEAKPEAKAESKGPVPGQGQAAAGGPKTAAPAATNLSAR